MDVKQVVDPESNPVLFFLHMKILHLISQLPDLTGSGKYLQALLRLCTKAGHENFLVAGIQDDFSLESTLIDKTRTLYVRFHGKRIQYRVPGMSDVMPYKSSVFSTLSEQQLNVYEKAFKETIETAVRLFKPEIIHSHHLWLVSAFAAEVAPSVPLVVSCHGTCLRQLFLCPHLKAKPALLTEKVRAIMALSRAQEQEILSTYPASKGKIHVVGAGFDDALFYPGKKSIPPPVELLYAGKLSKSKGVPWLLQSLKSMDSLPWRLHLAGGGSGEEKKLCMELAQGFGGKVVLHGNLDHPELAALMKKVHLFVLPSFFEGLPLVLMEALASGCFVVTTALPGTKEVLCDSEGFPGHRVTLIDLPELADIDTPHESDMPFLIETLAKALAHLIEGFMNGSIINEEKADSITCALTWEKVFERIEEVYNKAVKG